MNAVRMQFGDDTEMDVIPLCVFCRRVIKIELDVWGKTKCCEELCHYRCFRDRIDEQMNRGLYEERTYCVLCHSLCVLSPVMSDLL